VDKALTKQQFVVLATVSISACAVFLVSNWSCFIHHTKYTSCTQCWTIVCRTCVDKMFHNWKCTLDPNKRWL